ncbi:unnamed protein product [Trichobilharzia regenti]|nr:unnamed protein product [Trichobilharzia regenti]
MAEHSIDEGDWDDDVKNKYKPPEKRTLDELKSLDKEDESLQRYKQALLGAAVSTINAPCDLSSLKSRPVQIVEGSSYRIQVIYYVQRDIVCGLRFKQWTNRGPLRVDKVSVMLGSYGPQATPYEWKSEPEEAPKGALSRGTYHIKSQFTDDDKTDYVTWEWCINVIK